MWLLSLPFLIRYVPTSNLGPEIDYRLSYPVPTGECRAGLYNSFGRQRVVKTKRTNVNKIT